MKQHPVSVPADSYCGADARKRAKSLEVSRVAVRIEHHINELVSRWEDDTIGAIMSYEVASALGENSALVYRLISRIDGGSNGVTICKGDYERAIDRQKQSGST